ncbi:MAG: hypothetical protein GAK28_04697 [Luteibacter sp.]|uniref:hypothetical protein n=1 Tax=Luteibacter sp. TaxID=1886636 RepID=UPI0013860F69|nr:hypothetical protein [Luteibacter sp.]KAF1003412.1 MAG: hypothetical protein GAK28_04697 [Luteibacter sp.]
MPTRIPEVTKGLLVGALLLLGGCGNCNLLSSGNSFGCKAGLAAGVVVLAPVALASNAMDAHRDRAREADNLKLLKQGDPLMTARCVIRCDLPDKLDKATDMALYRGSVDKVIAWWGDHPLPTQKPVLMVAFLRKAAPLMDSDPAQAERWLRKAAALSVDPETGASLSSTEFAANTWSMGSYTDAVQDIQSALMALRYKGIPGRAADQGALTERCQAIAAWPPTWLAEPREKVAARNALQTACRSAYSRQFHTYRLDDDRPVVEGILDPIDPVPPQ